MKRVFLLLLAQLFSIFCYPNPTETVGSLILTGRVTDTYGNPLIGATVLLEGYMLGTSTNTDGSFALKRLNAGSYVISASYIGYNTERMEITIPETLHIDIVLKAATVMCDEVVVNSTRASRRMPIAQSAMTKDDIRGNNATADIPVMLETMPSVVSTTEGGAGIGNTSFRIRGTDMSRINVTVNNIPLNEAESQSVFWVNMPDFSSSVDNVQIQRGVGTSTNGAAAFGATVNFQTSSVEPEPFANVDLVYGSFNTFKTSANIGTGLMKNGFNFEGRMSKVSSDGYIDRGKSDHQSLFITAAWYGERNLIRFNLIHGEEHTGITWEGTPGYMLQTNRTYNPAGEYTDANGETRYYDNQTDNYWQTHYHLMASHSFSDKLRANVTLHATDGRGYYEEYKTNKKFAGYYGLPPVIIGADTITKANFVHRKQMDNIFYGAIASLNYNTGSIDATAGGSWNQYDGDHFGNIIWASVNNGIDPNYEWYRNNGLKTDWNVFAKAIWQASNSLILFADAQYRSVKYELSGIDSDVLPLDQQHQWNFFNPKFGLSVNVNASNSIYFSTGISNREPTRSDIKDAMKGTSNVVPKSERLTDFELGYKFKHPAVAADLNLYYMKYKNQLVLTGELSDVGYALMDNVPDSYRAGIELIVAVKPASWIKWEANATFSKNIIKDFVEYVDLYDNTNDWNSLPQQANPLGNCTISFSPSVIGASVLNFYPTKNTSLAWISKFVGKQYIDNTQNETRMLDSYWVNNLKAEYRMNFKGTKSCFVQALVNNVLNLEYESNAWVYRAKFQSDNSEYREDGYFPQAGINFAIRVGVDF